MRKLIGAVVAGLMLASAFTGGADARPKYKKEFENSYPKVDENNKITCKTCHPEKSKKVRNEYAKDLSKHIGENEKDEEKIKEALKKNEKETRPSDGKTWGEILAAGKLPTDE